MTAKLRRAEPGDGEFIFLMMYEAVFWDKAGADRPPVEEMFNQDEILPRYTAEWGRKGDEGVIAEEDGRPVGAAWFRFYTAAEPAYGFVAEDIPEIAIGLLREARGRGTGTALLKALLDRAKDLSYRTVCLSAYRDNPAMGLYEKFGFERLELDDEGYWTMKKDLRAR